ncbi:MAG: hypothetical protein LBU70_09635 [Chitinispirillales bacterium]|jgi:hypothetical protein|nr:hypothetical protein [Chitinispirillales bacterium]
MSTRQNVFLIVLLTNCLILFSCLSNVSGQEESSPEISTEQEDSLSDVVENEPSIFDCPPEDIDEYPISELTPWHNLGEHPPAGWCGRPLKLSIEALSFNALGGIRCVATTGFLYAHADMALGCRTEDNRTFRKVECPWYTATKIDERTLHVSVKPNTTGREKNTHMSISTGICGNSFVISQSTTVP